MAQTYYPWSRETLLAGQIADNMPAEIVTAINDSPRTAQVDTITVVTATHSHEYTLEIDGVEISYTADAATTKAEVSAGLTAAINDEPLVSGRVVAEDKTESLTITGRTAGIGFTVSNLDALCTNVHTTANDEADPIEFGVLVTIDGTNADKGVLAASAALTAKVVYCTPAPENSLPYHLGVKVDGVTYVSTFTSDASATAKEIVEGMVALLNAQLPASTVVATEDDTKVILTAEVAGKSFEVLAGNGGATGVWTITDSVNTVRCDINEAVRGITVRVRNAEMDADGNTNYAKNSVMSLMKKGRIVVDTEETITSDKRVFVGVAAGTKGKWTGSATADYVPLDSSKFKWVRAQDSDSAVLSINLP